MLKVWTGLKKYVILKEVMEPARIFYHVKISLRHKLCSQDTSNQERDVLIMFMLRFLRNSADLVVINTFSFGQPC